MKTQIVMISMWIISALLLSFNYPNIAGALFGILVAGFIVHYTYKFGNNIANWIWDLFTALGNNEKV